MGLSYNYVTGHASDVLRLLRAELERLVINVSDFKVGLTTDPEGRWKAHAAKGWRKMQVIYGTASASYAAEVEDHLIVHGWKPKIIAACWNEVRGGGGLVPGADYYYVYVIST